MWWVDGYSKAQEVQSSTFFAYDSNTTSITHLLVSMGQPYQTWYKNKKTLLQTSGETTSRHWVVGCQGRKIPYWADHDFLKTKQMPKSQNFCDTLWLGIGIKVRGMGMFDKSYKAEYRQFNCRQHIFQKDCVICSIRHIYFRLSLLPCFHPLKHSQLAVTPTYIQVNLNITLLPII